MVSPVPVANAIGRARCGDELVEEPTLGPRSSNVASETILPPPGARARFTAGSSKLDSTGRIRALPRARAEFLTLHFTGQPGDLVYAASNANAGWADVPVLHGVLLIGAPYRRRLLGIADGTGSLTATLPVLELGAGIEGTSLQMQIVAIERWITGSSAAVRLDGAL
jgi:hypothetical protein